MTDNLNLQTIVLLLKQCIDIVEDIVKNNFLLMYVDFDLDHVWGSNFGALQFLYLPAEEERQNSGFMNFFERVISGIKVSDSLGKDILREIIYKVERMPFFSSRQLRAIIDSAEKEYEEMKTPNPFLQTDSEFLVYMIWLIGSHIRTSFYVLFRIVLSHITLINYFVCESYFIFAIASRFAALRSA